MDGRPILPVEGQLRILVDSRSVANSLANSDPFAERLLWHCNSKFFDWMRTPLASNHSRMNQVRQFESRYDKDGALIGIDWKITTPEEKSETSHGFGYRMVDIEGVAKRILKRDSITKEDMDRILLVFIQAALNSRNDHDVLLVTQDELLLGQRLWFESHFPGLVLNIASISEALEIMDLFVKRRGKYEISGNHYFNKGLWYWVSFRTKIPNYHVSTEILEAFSSRFVFLLMSLDEMGIQYYSGVNNDTMDNTLYHFNYFISLITGIFDCLAIETRNRLQLTFGGENMPWKTSLSNSAGREFLRALKEKNPSLRQRVDDHVDYRNLIYALRELVLHREGLAQTGYENRDSDARWKANFVKIPKEVDESIRRCGDKMIPHEVVSEWGVYRPMANVQEIGTLLSPYVFAKAATAKLIEFSNAYLKQLGFTNFMETLKPGDSLREEAEMFEQRRLGF